MGKATTTPVQVVMDDGTEYTVLLDQRDWAAWEAFESDNGGGPHTMLRYVCWTNMRRNEQYSGTWKKFNERDCVQCDSGSPQRAKQEGEETEDPRT